MPSSFYVSDQYIFAAAALIGTFMGCWLLLWLMLRPSGQALQNLSRASLRPS
jgi:flagellar motor component MotA